MDANKPKEGRRVLVVAPHADDMEFGCGGYVTKLIEQGAQVHLRVMMVSDTVSAHSGASVGSGTRVDEVKAAAEMLRLASWKTYDFMENDGVAPLAGMIAALDDDIELLKPDDMLIPLSSANQDHAAVWQACLAALRPNKISFQPSRALAYEQPMNCWGDTHLSGPIQGTVYVRLTQEQLGRKLRALAMHKSQVAGREYKLAGHWGVRNLAEMRGVECGALYAEKFHLLREVVS